MISERKSGKGLMNRKRIRDSTVKISEKIDNRSKKRDYFMRNRIEKQKGNSEIGNKTGIKICKPIFASEEDFKNPLSYFESLWEYNKESSGVLKIIPPYHWKKINDFIFETFCFPKFINSEKKLDIRIQNLSQLLKGKVIEYKDNKNFCNFLN